MSWPTVEPERTADVARLRRSGLPRIRTLRAWGVVVLWCNDEYIHVPLWTAHILNSGRAWFEGREKAVFVATGKRSAPNEHDGQRGYWKDKVKYRIEHNAWMRRALAWFGPRPDAQAAMNTLMAVRLEGGSIVRADEVRAMIDSFIEGE